MASKSILYPPHQIGWHWRSARGDDLKRGHVARGQVQRFQQVEQHGGNGKTGCDALFLDQSRKDIRVEPLDQQHLGCGLKTSQGPRRTARRVKQRHEIGPDRVRPHLLAGAEEPRVVHQVFVAENRAFWKTGCPRGVLNLRGVIRLDVGQDGGPASDGEKCVLIFQIDDLAQMRVAFRRLERNLSHRIASEPVHHEQADRSGLLQHIPELGGLKGRIGCNQNQPAQPAGIFHENPLGNIGCPDDDPFTWLEPGGEGAGQALGLRQYLRIGP